MNKDTQLIYETYVEESRARSSVLAIMCALGLGCGTTTPYDNDQHRSYEQIPTKNQPREPFWEWMDALGPLLKGWLNSGVSEEQKLHLGHSIKQQVEQGTPEEGWEDWFKRWQYDNKV